MLIRNLIGIGPFYITKETYIVIHNTVIDLLFRLEKTFTIDLPTLPRFARGKFTETLWQAYE